MNLLLFPTWQRKETTLHRLAINLFEISNDAQMIDTTLESIGPTMKTTFFILSTCRLIQNKKNYVFNEAASKY